MLQEARRGDPGATDELYDRFTDAVAQQQLASWLMTRQGPLLDLTPGAPSAGHTRADQPVIAMRRDLELVPGQATAGVRGDDLMLDCLAPGSLGGIVAEQGALADCIVVEETLRRARQALRPGGGVLICVDSVVNGMASLAAAERWAELADAPQADVVLVGNLTDGLTRCFSATELGECATDAGLTVEWIRPRTVLAAETVRRALGADPSALRTLVTTECRLAAERDGEVIGRQLVMSAVRTG